MEGVLINNVGKIYNITSIVSCGVQGTAFFIDENHAITAKHCVEKNLSSGEDIILFFYDELKKSRSTHAKIIDFDDSLDIALLKIETPVSHIQNWIEVCNDVVTQDDDWETVGYPEDWNESEEGTRHCYIDGDIHYIDNFEGKTKYDIHLHSELIKEDWPYSLGGLSGSPLIVNGKITGFIIREENSAIKSQLKAVSFNKAEPFLVRNKTQINSSFISNNSLVIGRMKTQKVNCNNLFQKIETPLLVQSSNVIIDSYYLKYSKQGESKISELAKYLADALNQYVCELSEIKELTTEPTKVNEIYRKTRIAIQEIYRKGKLGSIILWMILEGVLETPKFFKRISLRDSNENFSEVHIGMRNSKLLFYLGEGKLASDFKECVKEAIKQLEDVDGFEEDIFTSDEEMYKDLRAGHFKALIDKFINNETREWDDVTVELTVFTGYNSLQLRGFENANHQSRIENIVKQYFPREFQSNNEFILDELQNSLKENISKINWFILPFNDIDDFEKLVLKEFV